ncbi:MAG: hypothetical protein NTU88_08235, partial [Armatimonadetes bacterium]|nr:hypothetical protein [Armatimonadota bacterium]
LRAIDQALISPRDLPEIELQALYELDADCAEALWALDQPPGSLNFKAMLRDTLASLQRLPHDRDLIRSRIIPTAHGRVIAFEKTIRASLDPREAYNDIPPPHSR